MQCKIKRVKLSEYGQRNLNELLVSNADYAHLVVLVLAEAACTSPWSVLVFAEAASTASVLVFA